MYSIISNNCMSLFLFKELYYPNRDINFIQFNNPFIGCLFPSDNQYAKFCNNYDYYINIKPIFGEPLVADRKQFMAKKPTYPVMFLEDIEIHWIHEKNNNLLMQKYNERLRIGINDIKIFTWYELAFYNIDIDIDKECIIKTFMKSDGIKIFLSKNIYDIKKTNTNIFINVPDWKNIDNYKAKRNDKNIILAQNIILETIKNIKKMETDYNNIYLKQSNKSRLRRIPFYKELASHINQNDMVLDLGCGNGMLPIFSKFKKYKGIDFSEIAIEQAKRFCKTAEFICGDVITFIKKEKYTLVVLTEFLEHVDNDIEIITLIKKGSNVLISVPFDEPIINDRPKGYPTHKRSYTIQSFKSRYKDIKFEKIYVFNTWIIALGIKI